jgi:hypothetical protein
MANTELMKVIIGELKVLSEWLKGEGKEYSAQTVDVAIQYVQELKSIRDTE